MHRGHYILDNRNRVISVRLMKWRKWLEADHNNGRNIVKQQYIAGFFLSTVFLGVNHNWGSGPPLLFETMLFMPGGGGGELYYARYSTWKQAEKGHHATMLRLRRCRRGKGLQGKLMTAQRILKEFDVHQDAWGQVSAAIWAGGRALD